MLTLRLARRGTKKRPVYHLVAADRRARRDGRFVENLGYYIPGRNILVMKQDRIEYWLSVGAQTTETARHLIRQAKKHGNQEPVAKPKYTPPPPKAKPADKAEKTDKKKAGDDAKALGPKEGGEAKAKAKADGATPKTAADGAPGSTKDAKPGKDKNT